MDVRVRDREGCVLEPDKWGGMARVMMAMLRGLVVEIVFASRVVTRISPETGRNNRGNRVHTQGDITSQNRVSYFVFWEILFQYPFFNPAF